MKSGVLHCPWSCHNSILEHKLLFGEFEQQEMLINCSPSLTQEPLFWIWCSRKYEQADVSSMQSKNFLEHFLQYLEMTFPWAYCSNRNSKWSLKKFTTDGWDKHSLRECCLVCSTCGGLAQQVVNSTFQLKVLQYLVVYIPWTRQSRCTWFSLDLQGRRVSVSLLWVLDDIW